MEPLRSTGHTFETVACPPPELWTITSPEPAPAGTLTVMTVPFEVTPVRMSIPNSVQPKPQPA